LIQACALSRCSPRYPTVQGRRRRPRRSPQKSTTGDVAVGLFLRPYN
jgi:hypothetical protein